MGLFRRRHLGIQPDSPNYERYLEMKERQGRTIYSNGPDGQKFIFVRDADGRNVLTPLDEWQP